MYTVFVSAFTNIALPNSRTSSIISRMEGDKMVLTTDFNHTEKRYYEAGEADHEQQMLLHVPSYKKNLSIQRICSHLVFAWKVRKKLNALSESQMLCIVLCRLLLLHMCVLDIARSTG